MCVRLIPMSDRTYEGIRDPALQFEFAHPAVWAVLEGIGIT